MGFVGFNKATICENGHVISSNKDYILKNCNKCGSTAISKCQYCGSYIKGSKKYSVGQKNFDSWNYSIPYYCDECKKPYQWTTKILSNAVEIAELDNLSNEMKDIIKSAIPYLLVESPENTISTARFAKVLQSSSEIARNCFKQLLSDVVISKVAEILF